MIFESVLVGLWIFTTCLDVGANFVFGQRTNMLSQRLDIAELSSNEQTIGLSERLTKLEQAPK